MLLYGCFNIDISGPLTQYLKTFPKELRSGVCSFKANEEERGGSRRRVEVWPWAACGHGTMRSSDGFNDSFPWFSSRWSVLQEELFRIVRSVKFPVAVNRIMECTVLSWVSQTQLLPRSHSQTKPKKTLTKRSRMGVGSVVDYWMFNISAR